MAINLYNIKKWYRMMAGKSVLHVNQDLGKYFDPKELKGYYNNMMEKVSYVPHFVESDQLPIHHAENGKNFMFPVAVFQFAFGLLDFYYETKEEKYISKFRQCAEWALNAQLFNGAWDNFSFRYPDYPYGAMAQGEGVSFLLRAYVIFKEEKYLMASQKAIHFLLKDVEAGGCTRYANDDVILLEYQHLPVVLNGWIFSWWGLYDYVLVTQDDKVKCLMNNSLKTLVKKLPEFANSYWSMYDNNGKIASPFYHNLHIAQMQAMYKLTNEPIFNEFAVKWKREQNNFFCKGVAFVKKSIQKILE